MNKDAEQLLRVLRREKKSLGNKDAEQFLRVRRRDKKSRGNKDAEKLLRVRREILVGGHPETSSTLFSI